MPFVAKDFADHAGTVVGNGHCVALVRTATNMPPTAQWHAGEAVRDAGLASGICIATFDDTGRYENDTGGRSHACIYLRHVPGGIEVFDQWKGKKAGIRVIRDRQGAGLWVDDASRYAVIEVT